MNSAQIEKALLEVELPFDVAFEILQSISQLLAKNPESAEAQSLLIKSLERPDAFEGAAELLNALLRETGLYPYVDKNNISLRDLVAYEFHRPTGRLGDSMVFHRAQAQVFWELDAGNNVILSAPTSFGKSLLIDAIIASKKHEKIVVVVPTIALIDETRRRLHRFADSYKIITHPSQIADPEIHGTIFVLTQERVIERSDLGSVDFFVIDEFYKLGFEGGRRGDILNHAFYKLLKTGAQYYLLGPNIRDVPLDEGGLVSAKVIVTDYATVATRVEKVRTRPGGKKKALVKLAQSLDEPTLVYCKAPGSVRTVARLLLDEKLSFNSPDLDALADWLDENYHPDWTVAQALRHGIGVHHGKIPRAIAQLQVRLFNQGKIKFLICTSTLIEGVNTSAKHVVIYDNMIASTKFDYFTFKNIQGRSGRMLKHFTGHVHLLTDPPEPVELDVSFPVILQDERASDGLLVQIDPSDLNAAGEPRMVRHRGQMDLSFHTIRENKHIDPDKQVNAARQIKAQLTTLQPKLGWVGRPDWGQLLFTCEFLFDTLLSGEKSDSVWTARQLATLLM